MLYRHCPSTWLWNTPFGRIKETQTELETNGTHQLLVYAAHDVKLLGEDIQNIQKNTEASLITSEQIGPEVNAELSTWHIIVPRIMFCEQNA
jgi:hypothetical protein